MTLPQVNERFLYWQDHPPVHELVAAYLGHKKRAAQEILPVTKISPMLGEIAGEEKVLPKPANDLGALVELAKKKGGEISLDMLMGLG